MWPFTKRYPPGVGDIQRQLFVAINDRRLDRLAVLIERYDEVIRHQFDQWRRAPEGYRSGRWEDWYATGLIGLAELYDRNGVSSLLDALSGANSDNPIASWRSGIESAQAELAAGRVGPAAAQARSVVEAMADATGSAVDTYLPVALGVLGGALHGLGEPTEAIGVTERALALCRGNGDSVGVATYKANVAAMRSDD